MLDYATTWGDPDNPTVVLLHPAGGSRHNWRPHAELLQDDYHVVGLDLPGHGIHPVADFDYDRAVDDLDAILDDVGSAVLVGHSQGGYVAIRAAAAHHDRVDGLLLAGADYDWRKPKILALTAVYYPLTYVLEAVSHSDRLREWVIDRFGEGDDPRQQPPDDEDTYGALRGNATSFRANVFQATWQSVEQYDGPILIGHGEQEPFQGYAETLAERVDARLKWYSGGHQAPMDNIDEFADVVRDFLDDVYGEQKASPAQP